MFIASRQEYPKLRGARDTQFGILRSR